MQIVTTIADLRHIIHTWKAQGKKVAFVPTMGNLHDGHIHLVKQAKSKAQRVVVSIFVNPTQFGVGEDFSSYPRTETQDQEKLLAIGTDLVFLPSVAEMYNPNAKTTVTVSGLSDIHCGASRMGHFAGVATVVCKLFNMVQPDIALFGLKDFQQLMVIRTMVRDLNIPVEILGIDTVRENDGLAMSSRNGYLTQEERETAPLLYQTLCQARDAILQGVALNSVTEQATNNLQQAGFQVDYFNVCCADDLSMAENTDTDLVILTAAKLGKTRLIDNLTVSR
ncbi:pantoate--beta-alanine ligase [Patescibacteria group bacterium]|nr:pantoate--beta-alanine ligase [Patescibacteria group bacterium]